MLQLQNISKSYTTGDFTQKALDDVSITFRDNEFVAVLGPSGSGKTTLLNMIGGLDHYDTGNLIIDGISTENYKDRDWDTYRNNRIGFVFQSYNLIPHQTVLANVELALTLSGVPRAERHERAIKALEEVGLGEHIDKKPSQLSGGQMQRVAIARALINDPEILLADEPTGALDSKTSVQVMDLLTQIASDRLVIMVTHNPDLADQYANRVVHLTDGAITGDSNPYEVSPDDMQLSNKEIRKTSMSFGTALALSFRNLLTKKGRTIMTAIAGSIGIIGIAAILALSQGVNDYIRSIEEDTLSVYPLDIASTGVDMSSMMASNMEMITDNSANEEDDESSPGTVKETSMITRMFSNISNNDLASLKSYFDSGKSDIDSYVNTIEYGYDVTPQVYSADTSDGVNQINPDTTFSSAGLDLNSGNSLMSMYMSFDVFDEMMSDTSMIEDQYDMVAGHWPEKYNECIVVLSSGGNITDYMAYSLGLRDPDELEDMVSAFLNDEDIDVPDDNPDFTYDDILNLKMKLVCSADYYSYDSSNKIWVDKSDDEKYMKDLVDNGEDIVISGIVSPKEDATATSLTAGVYYTPALIDHLIDEAADKKIVKDQLKDTKTDVFTGKSFKELEEEGGNSDLDLTSMFTIDTGALSESFGFDSSALDFSSLASGIDLSSMDMSGLDMSSLNLDLSNMDLDLSGLDMDFDLDLGSDLKLDLSSLDLSDSIKVNSSAMTSAAIELASKFISDNENLIGNGKEDDIDKALSSFLQSTDAQSIMAKYANQIVDLSGLSSSLQDQLQSVVSKQLTSQLSNQLSSQVADTLQTQITDQLSSQLQSQLQNAIGEMMTSSMMSMTSAITDQITSAMNDSMDQLSSTMSSAMNIDPDAFTDAFDFDVNQDELMDLITSALSSDTAAYDSNLASLGYADVDKPQSISIYPKDFDSKQEVIDILDGYNDKMEADGEEDKTITYTDIVGTLMSSVTTIVNMLSTVLIAFVAISLVVSSIMIGVITYISVLERRKEIGILRALGASKGDVGRVFNAETIIEGLVAGLIGIGITAIACFPVSAIAQAVTGVPNVMQLPVLYGLGLILLSVVLTFIAGLIPSSSASRKDPVEALRSE